jgi:hypothetical protein
MLHLSTRKSCSNNRVQPSTCAANTPTAKEVWSCKRDEGRSLGVGDQAQAPNHCELLPLKAVVVSVAGKGGTRSRQVRSGETSENEALMTCRNSLDGVETRGRVVAPGMSSGGVLETGPSGTRLGGGVNPDQALCGTREPVAPWEKLKREAPARAGVPMRGTGTEQSVVGMKVLQWNWTEGAAVSCRSKRPTGDGRSRMIEAKPFDIPKWEVWEAFKKVKANRGAAGVDAQSIAEFEAGLADNLYKLWNRLSSGSYFPPPVRRVDIPKAKGGTRPLGIPTVADRVAQEVVRRYLEPCLDPVFHADSYGYRPGRSAIDAVRTTRQRCWRYDWVLDIDIKAFFDSIDHELLLRAVRRHTDCPWVLLARARHDPR